jgi:hypothetical protein
MTDKSQQWIWFINKENPKRIHKTFLGTFLKDIKKPYIFFCTYLDARKWKARTIQ